MNTVIPNQRDRAHTARCASRGVTLVEAVLSLAILGIIMATIGAATSVMMRLMPRSNDPRTVSIAVGSVMELFDSDVNAAIAVQLAENDQVHLLVNGLGGGGGPASVVYEYDSGESRLLRGVEGESPTPILTGLVDAEFQHTTIQRASADEVEPVAEASTFGTESVACNESTVTIESGLSIRQRIEPALDDGASGWKIESFTLRLKQHVIFGSGTCRIAFHHMNDDGTMDPTPFASRNIAISSLALSAVPATWRTIEFVDMPWLGADQSVAVLLIADGGSFRTHLATMAGHPFIDYFNSFTGEYEPIPGPLLCFRLTGQAMVPGEEPAQITLMRSLSLHVHHPVLGEPVVHDARPMVPIAFQP